MKRFDKTLADNCRRVAAMLVATALLNVSASVAFASLPESAAPLGVLEASGTVTVNDIPAMSGETILSGSRIVTETKSNSVIELGKFRRLIISEQSDLELRFTEASISSSLRKGEIRAFIPATKTLSIVTPAGLVTTDPSQTAVVNVQVEDDVTRISVESGLVELCAGGSSRTVAVGETFSTALDTAGSPVPSLNLNKAEKVGLIAGIGTALAILLVAITGDKTANVPDSGCVVILSGTTGGCR